MTDPTTNAPAKPNARTGRKFLALREDQQQALADLGKTYGVDADVATAFLRAALTPEKIRHLVLSHLAGVATTASGRNGSVPPVLTRE